MGKILIYFRTIKHLRFIQIYFRLRYILKKFSYKEKNFNFKIRVLKNTNNLFFLKKTNSIVSISKFKFINETHKINNNWNIKSQNKLWLYNLHYFDFINSNYKNYKFLKMLIFKWISIDNNLKKVGLEPYPTSLRIVNWTKFFINQKLDDKELNSSLYNQLLYLNDNLEYHLLGNHYFANIKALIFGCLYFDTKKTNKILIKILPNFANELKNQILNDGGHAEFSPMYHAIILEDIIDIISLFKFYKFDPGKQIKDLLFKKSYLMINWLNLLTHPSGQYCKFNDSTEDIAQSFFSLKKYYKKVCKKNFYNINVNNHLKETGYFTHRRKDIFFSTNIGNSSVEYLSGHTHSDTFSFEFSYKNNIFFTNGGISTYKSGFIREFERSSANHNTVIVDKRNSSEVWKSFRLARRPVLGSLKIKRKRFETIISNFFLDYKNKYKHSRTVSFKKKNIKITDKNDTYSFFSRFILQPDIKIKIIDKKTILLNKGKTKLKIISYSGDFLTSKFKFKKGFNLIKQTFCIDITSIEKKVIFEMVLL